MGKRPGIGCIQKTAQRLQEAYRLAGYGAVVVLVPEQTLDGLTVRLEVIEGKLSQIQVAGMHEFSRENILRSLPSLVLHQTPSLAALDSELLMVNENPAKSVRVVLQPGEKKAQVEALIVVQEQAIQQWIMSLDNTGNDSTGQYRLSLGYQNANFRDTDAVFGLRLVTSPTELSQVGILSSTFRMPIYRHKIFWEWSALVSNTRNTPNQTPAGELRFSGAGLSVGARAIWTLPSLGEYKQQASLGLERRQYRNTCTLGTFGAAGCGTAAASVDVLPLTVGYTFQKPGMAYATVQGVSNLALGSAGDDGAFDASRPGAVSHYQLVRANAASNLALSPKWTLAWHMDAQLAAQALVSAEQYGAGGSYSVRGYPERIVSGDSGALLSGELSTSMTPMLGVTESPQSLQVSWFFDAATVRNRLNTACAAGQSACTLWGTGVALLWRSGTNASARVALARAGKSINNIPSGDLRLHFSLTYQL